MTPKVKRYSDAFRRQVVSEYEAGASIYELQRKYGITGGQTIQRWIKKFGREGMRHDMVHIQISDEVDRLKQMERRVEELEQALGKVMLEKLKLESILEVLQGSLPEDVKKNVPKSSKPSSAKPTNKRGSK